MFMKTNELLEGVDSRPVRLLLKARPSKHNAEKKIPYQSQEVAHNQ